MSGSVIPLAFHKMTSGEELGAGYGIIIDIEPSTVPDEAADWNGVLVRTGRFAWGWYARDFSKKGNVWRETGVADTKEDAIDDAMDAVRQHLESG